ncbi:calcium-translocating P-type ATPase [Conidiobolus coronatus NRRL 28638]|uniref:Calcium-transporting ATPase n=1 Tax=Conidiobolus coronatus (strain ATCC 28846 / CBS 209.66 / NRRL 28638) TaxID=796925 RepID=A0A137NVG5_CONC2|nr:calcium-translocating P-type ATPase [Conidiobolus coronatus NRRL 28638]|eukprot:KXN66752.1 calcium-translocating P-type ATPase [Conidiobolus coronatus NRRL 28638]
MPDKKGTIETDSEAPKLDLDIEGNGELLNTDNGKDVEKTPTTTTGSKTPTPQHVNEKSSDNVKQYGSGEFPLKVDELQTIFDPKDLEKLAQLTNSSTSQLLASLHTDKGTGLTSAELTDVDDKGKNQRQRVYGVNRLPAVKTRSLLELMWIAMHDSMIILLSIAALVSLAIGIYQDVATPPETFKAIINGEEVTLQVPPVHWVEGVAILVAVLIVLLAGSINDWRKEKQFQKLNSKKDDRELKLVRDGKVQEISVYDICVGDIILCEPGDILAADGIILESHNLQCDESSATGESDAMIKITMEECLRISGEKGSAKHKDPFMLSGSKVLEGVGKYVVTNVGEHSFFGKIMMNLRGDPEETPLQIKLGFLAERIAKLGGAAALLMLVIQVIIYFVNWNQQDHVAYQVVNSLVNILIIAITVVVVAVPEGLPLAVTLSLSFATVRMLKDNNLVRVLAACETMGNATTICSDKTGTLTQNKMTVVAGTLGLKFDFVRGDGLQTSSGELETVEFNGLNSKFKGNQEWDILHDNIAINSTAFEKQINTGEIEFVGSKTEVALLQFSKLVGAPEVEGLRNRYPIIQVWPFSSSRKMMATLIKVEVNGNTVYRLLVKGASEIILSKCSSVANMGSDEGSDKSSNTPLDKESTLKLEQRISEYAQHSLRTIGLAYIDVQLSTEESNSYQGLEEDQMADFWSKKALSNQDWTLSGIVGIEDPLREGVSKAVADCKHSGVVVRMVTGDNIVTAKAIAIKCGIYRDGAVIMEGPEFRKLSDAQLDQILPRLRVLARSSPEDKMKLVKRLRHLGQVVAVTGDGTNDGPALKAADVGFSMGIAGTEVAKEASSIVLMDDNFSSIVKAIVWGRTVNDSIKKFLQFQLTTNITAVLVTFISSIVDPSDGPVLTAVQLLWVNLIMDTLAALALATDPPDEIVLDRPPESKKAPLINIQMWKMIIGQAIFQVAVCFSLLYGGATFYDDEFTNGRDNPFLRTLVFNTFVLMQLFNEINCRSVDHRLNVFKGLHKNFYFIGIIIFSFAAQAIIVEFGSFAFSTSPLNGPLWGISIGLAFMSLPIGVIIRLIPTDLFGALPSSFNRSNSLDEDPEEGPLDNIRSDLSFLHNLRSKRAGSRTASAYHSPRSNHHKSILSGHEKGPVLQGLIVPSMIGSSIGMGGQGYSPNSKTSPHNPVISNSPTKET